MIERYKVRETDGEYLQEVVDIKTDTVEGFSSRKGVIDLCAKLNRLTALEAVCREILESAPEELHREDTEIPDNTRLAYDMGWAEGEYELAQKLKAVLEEA